MPEEPTGTILMSDLLDNRSIGRLMLVLVTEPNIPVTALELTLELCLHLFVTGRVVVLGVGDLGVHAVHE